MECESPAIIMLSKAFSYKIQLNGEAYTSNCDTKSRIVQGDDEMESTGLEQEYMAGIFIENQEKKNNELILR